MAAIDDAIDVLGLRVGADCKPGCGCFWCATAAAAHRPGCGCANCTYLGRISWPRPGDGVNPEGTGVVYTRRCGSLACDPLGLASDPLLGNSLCDECLRLQRGGW